MLDASVIYKDTLRSHAPLRAAPRLDPRNIRRRLRIVSVPRGPAAKIVTLHAAFGIQAQLVFIGNACRNTQQTFRLLLRRQEHRSYTSQRLRNPCRPTQVFRKCDHLPCVADAALTLGIRVSVEGISRMWYCLAQPATQQIPQTARPIALPCRSRQHENSRPACPSTLPKSFCALGDENFHLIRSS